jgi:4-hydroxy-2-oxoheptanedioate aldolase
MQYGTWSIIPSVQVATILAQKLDFVIIDREHGNASYEDVLAMCTAIQLEKKVCFARPSSNNETEILHLLDSGVDGIIIPHVSTVEDVAKFIEYTNFPPRGNRGYTPFVRAGRYGEFRNCSANYKEDADSMLVRGIIIEDMRGVSNLPAILQYPINMVYIGIYDLASSLNVAIGDPKVSDVFNIIRDMVIPSNKYIGAIFHDEKSLRCLQNQDVEFAVYNTDTAIIKDALRRMRTW